MKLSELPRRTVATVASVDDQMANDPIARRLRELGFVPGEQVEVMAFGPIAAEPMLVQVGFTRFALRRREAARIAVQVGAPAPRDALGVAGLQAPPEDRVASPEPADATCDSGPVAATEGPGGGGRDMASPPPAAGRASA